MSMYKIKQLPEDFVVTENSSIIPGKRGKYCYFRLWKRNYNTEDAIKALSEYLNIPRKLFGYAGTKDRRAITEQLCSVRGMIRDLELKDLKVSVIGFGDKPVSLGDLNGNSFEIVVRNIEDRPKPVQRVVNCFDEQRFGIRKDNHIIGRLLIMGDFKGAVEYLTTRDQTNWDKYGWKAYLGKHENDYVGALRLIPRKILLMYVHAYESYLWNKCVAMYLELKGEKMKNIDFPIIGFGTESDDPEIKKICSDILCSEGISLRDFIVRQFPELSCEGSTRKIIADIENLEIGELEEDELGHKKKVKVKFYLGAGCYATVVIKKLFDKNTIR
ncbi:tRNA pseudouridine(13) synthase TruD [Candidatus Woesearchaeota archaeon]|nr:tRNA pseudouridine(13) synthase TruD [Candidatus Woesearchaeota archaeon]